METKTFPGVSCITTDIPTPMKCPLVHRKFGLTSTAAAEVMKETSSAPATHTLAPAMPLERTQPRGSLWSSSLPSMATTDM